MSTQQFVILGVEISGYDTMPAIQRNGLLNKIQHLLYEPDETGLRAVIGFSQDTKTSYCVIGRQLAVSEEDDVLGQGTPLTIDYDFAGCDYHQVARQLKQLLDQVFKISLITLTSYH